MENTFPPSFRTPSQEFFSSVKTVENFKAIYSIFGQSTTFHYWDQGSSKIVNLKIKSLAEYILNSNNKNCKCNSFYSKNKQTRIYYLETLIKKIQTTERKKIEKATWNLEEFKSYLQTLACPSREYKGFLYKIQKFDENIKKYSTIGYLGGTTSDGFKETLNNFPPHYIRSLLKTNKMVIFSLYYSNTLSFFLEKIFYVCKILKDKQFRIIQKLYIQILIEQKKLRELFRQSMLSQLMHIFSKYTKPANIIVAKSHSKDSNIKIPNIQKKTKNVIQSTLISMTEAFILGDRNKLLNSSLFLKDYQLALQSFFINLEQATPEKKIFFAADISYLFGDNGIVTKFEKSDAKQILKDYQLKEVSFDSSP